MADPHSVPRVDLDPENLPTCPVFAGGSHQYRREIRGEEPNRQDRLVCDCGLVKYDWAGAF